MKPLKILLANNTLSLLAGSETWTKTLALQLKAMGHEVTCFSPSLGVISDQLTEAGIKCYAEIHTSKIKPFSFILEETASHNYDVIIANHNHIVKYLREQFPKTPIISTIHGVIHTYENGSMAPEYPAVDSNVNQFVAVSEEVRDLLKSAYGIESVIVRNFFDIEKFSSLGIARPAPKQFMINTNYLSKDDKVIQSIRDASKHFGARVAAIGENFTLSNDVTKAIEDSDVIFGMGRSLLEGMAAGRLGICYGRWGMGGVLNESTVKEIRFFNFSGRNSDQTLDLNVSAEDIIKMIEENYNPETLNWSAEYVARDHNVVFAADEYVRIARELIENPLDIIPVGTGAVAPGAKPFRLAK